MYFMYRGEVEVLIGPDEKRVATLQDGSLFGEMALLGNGKRAATIRAIEVSDCRVIHATAFHTCLKRFPKERKYFDQLAQERLAEINKTKDTKDAGGVTPKLPVSPPFAPSSLLRLRKFKRPSNAGLTLERGREKMRSTTTSGAIKHRDDHMLSEDEPSSRSPSAPPTITPLTARIIASDTVDEAGRPICKQPASGRACHLRMEVEFESLDQSNNSLPHPCKVHSGRRRSLTGRRRSDGWRPTGVSADFFRNVVACEASPKKTWSEAMSDETQPMRDKMHLPDVAHEAVSQSGQSYTTSATLSLPLLASSSKLGGPSSPVPPLSARFTPAAGGC